MSRNAGRSDRSIIRRMTSDQRLKAEGMLAKGVTGLEVTKKLGFPLSTWASAVKANPIPGGVLDPTGKRAKFEGEWMDLEGVVREYKGLNSKGKPKEGLPIVRRPGRKPRAGGVSKHQPPPPVMKHPPEPGKKKLLPFVSDPKPVVTHETSSVPSSAPTVSTEEDTRPRGNDDTPLADQETKGKRPRAGKASKLAERHYPLANRIKDLAAMKDKALKAGDIKTVVEIVKMFNAIDGTEAKARRGDEDTGRGSAPLFALPRGPQGVQPISLSPVGPITLRTGDEESEEEVVVSESEEDDPSLIAGDAVLDSPELVDE